MSVEEAIDYQERQLPLLSGQAFNVAFTETLAADESVLVGENGAIFEIYPDGRRTFVKSIELPLHLAPGTKIELR